jgi:zinc-ribbon domain
MNSSQSDSPDPVGGGDEPAGAERYLHPGEELRICSSDIQIKKFRFEAYLTNRRLFLIDQNDRKPGVTAKEIPVGSIIGSYLEDSPSHEPVIVLSVKTADDDIRTMKMTLAHTGEERMREAEDWLHLITHATATTDEGGIRPRASGPVPAPALSPEARALSDTLVFPAPQPEPVRERPAAVTQVRSQPPVAPAAPAPAPTQPQMVTTPIQFCFHCGKRLPPGANFCPYCGTRAHSSIQPGETQAQKTPPAPQPQPNSPAGETGEKKRGWRRFFGR